MEFYQYADNLQFCFSLLPSSKELVGAFEHYTSLTISYMKQNKLQLYSDKTEGLIHGLSLACFEEDCIPDVGNSHLLNVREVAS